MSLFEDYRPATWAEFIGNDKAVSRVRAIVSRARASGKPFSLWLDGASGTGKTCAAKLVSRELEADAFYGIRELDGDKCDKAAVHEIEQSFFGLRPLMGEWRVVIVNEAHSMTAGAVQSWLTLLEKLPNKCAVLFTTTESWKGEKALFGSFDHPLQSRATVVSLSNQGLAEAFAKRAQEIAEREGLGGATEKEYLALVRACKNNMRAVLSQIEGYEMHREVAGNVAA